MVSLQDFQDDLGLLVESGLLAIKQGDEESAKKIFDACDILDDTGQQKLYGYGLIAMHKMEIDKAFETFQKLIEMDPTNYRAKAFLGFTYILSIFNEDASEKKSEHLSTALDLAKEVIENCDEPSTKAVAESVIAWENEVDSLIKPKGPLG